MLPGDKCRVYDPTQDTNEDEPEQRTGDLLSERLRLIASTIVVTPAAPSLTELLVSLVREYEPVLEAAASFEDVWVVRRVVAFADDVCRAELEFLRERGGTGPLDVVLVVVGARVLAAHYVHVVEAAA